MVILSKRKLRHLGQILLNDNQKDRVRSEDAQGYTMLQRAAKDADLSLVKLLIELGADVNAGKPFCETPLYRTISFLTEEASFTRSQIIQALIMAGAAIKPLTPCSETLLSIAYEHNSSHCLRLLLAAGADPAAPSTLGLPIPEYVIKIATCLDATNFIAQMLAIGIDVNARDMNGDTLLERAAWLGSVSAIQALLIAGASPHSTGRYGNSALHYIPELMGHPQGVLAVEALYQAGADVNAVGTGGNTPLHRAALLDSSTSVTLLRHYGANSLHRNSRGRTALRAAVWAGSFVGEQTIRALLEGYTDSVDAFEDEGYPLLYVAARNGYYSTVKLLLEFGADPNGRIADPSCTLLHFAASIFEQAYGEQIIGHLIERGADINAQDSQGYSPLHSAVHSNHLEAVEFLIRKKADVHARDHFGQIPLHCAAIHSGREEAARMVATLLKAGSKPDIPDCNGSTPLILAAQRLLGAQVKMLLQAKTDPNRADYHGYAPLYYATDLTTTCYDARRVVVALFKAGADTAAHPERLMRFAIKHSIPQIIRRLMRLVDLRSLNEQEPIVVYPLKLVQYPYGGQVVHTLHRRNLELQWSFERDVSRFHPSQLLTLYQPLYSCQLFGARHQELKLVNAVREVSRSQTSQHKI